jgi:Ca-activated chloride channel family protein
MKAIKSLNFWVFGAIAANTLAAGLFLAGCARPAPAGLSGLPSSDGAPAYELARLSSQSTRPISAPVDTYELWIVSRNHEIEQAANNTPGSGSLVAEVAGQEVPMPLAHTDVKALVNGYISTVEVTQQFNNPYMQKIEAVYVFPLPHNAAVYEFIMTIGKRRIRGIIRERKEAEQIYAEAKRRGYVATLLTEERPNIFTQSVANIEPGNEIDVNIKYFSTLEYVDGWYEFVFPMVVGPRFNPPTTTNEVDVPYLRPGERNGHDISLRVDVNAGVPIEQFECKTHAVTKAVSSPDHLVVQLNPEDAIPDKDFVLRYRMANDRIKSNLLTHRDERGGYFTLMLLPPEELGNLPRQPLELVFVLDCSGSMSGRPIEQAKAAVERGLGLLRPGDSFQLINFSATTSQLGPAPIEAIPQNVQSGLNYLHSLNAEGGTMMMDGIKAALDFPHDSERQRFICFLTDGYVGNETEILGEIHKRLGDSRIFSFGIGTSVNRYLLDHMAKAGRGAVAYLGPNDSAAEIMENFFQRISHPALTNMKVDWGAMQVSEVFPAQIPDLFPGRPVILTGLFSGRGATNIRVTGNRANTPVQVDIPVNIGESSILDKALPSVWARMKIADLADRSIYEPDPQLPYEIKQVALDYGLTSPFTAFLAVDASEVTEGTESKTIPVAVPVPEGVNHDTTVRDK